MGQLKGFTYAIKFLSRDLLSHDQNQAGKRPKRYTRARSTLQHGEGACTRPGPPHCTRLHPTLGPHWHVHHTLHRTARVHVHPARAPPAPRAAPCPATKPDAPARGVVQNTSSSVCNCLPSCRPLGAIPQDTAAASPEELRIRIHLVRVPYLG